MDKGIILVGPLPPPMGGVSIHVSRLFELLRENRYDVSLFFYSKNTYAPAGATRCRGRIALLFKLGLRRKTAVVLHDHTELYQTSNLVISIVYLLVTIIRPSKLVLTIHDGSFPDRLRDIGLLRRMVIRALLRRMDRIIVISEAQRATIIHLGIQPNNIVLIKSFLPLSPERAELRSPLKRFLRLHPRTLVTIGAFSSGYHFDIVLRAFVELRRRLADIGLVLVTGSFGDQSSFRKLCEPFLKESGSSCLVMTDLPHAESICLLERSALLIRSAFPDGDGLSMREALQLGKPVVATDTGERPGEVFVYPPSDSERLAESIRLALVKGRTTRDVTKEAQRNLQGLMELYDSLSRSES